MNRDRWWAAAILAAILVACSQQAFSTQESEPPVSIPESAERRPNRLIHENSPYLLQHAHNPVDWYPWGEEAFESARKQDKPIFLSIGYSACHWCHVMERECFEVEAIAAVMNEHFVNIKVDREERPDVDELYMKAVQALTGGGGWPLSAWLTPEGEPFYGGTYFPPVSKYGRPGFPDVCRQLARAYHEQREAVVEQAGRLADAIRERVAVPSPSGDRELGAELLVQATRQIVGGFDADHGGFGGAPKFPHPMDHTYLLRRYRKTRDSKLLHVVEYSLDKMARGGMYDQLGGGFHRYSVDERWLIPHFEKMLYDNALLSRAYLDAYLVTGKERHAALVRDILDYVLREMTAPDGGFYSTQDADSEGEEGKFFAWDPAELRAVLGDEDGALAARCYGVTEDGNFEHGKSVLWLPRTLEEAAVAEGMEVAELQSRLESIRARLFTAREARIKPARDEKILADWNGMMISAMARAGACLAEERYLSAARRAAEFCLSTFVQADGRMLRCSKDGNTKIGANLGDHAMLVWGLIDLYEASFEPKYLAQAKRLTELSIERFWDAEGGGFFFTSADGEALLARSKEAYDGATPSAVSVHVGNLVRLSEALGVADWRERAWTTMQLYHALLSRAPQAVSEMLSHLDAALADPLEVVLVGESPAALYEMASIVRRAPRQDWILLGVTADTREQLEALSELVRGKQAGDGRTTAYVCQAFECQAPTQSTEELARSLGAGDPE